MSYLRSLARVYVLSYDLTLEEALKVSRLELKHREELGTRYRLIRDIAETLNREYRLKEPGIFLKSMEEDEEYENIHILTKSFCNILDRKVYPSSYLEIINKRCIWKYYYM